MINKTLALRLVTILAIVLSTLGSTLGGIPVQAATGTWTDDVFDDGTFNNTELVSGEVALVETQDFLDDFDTGSLDPAHWELDNWLDGVVGLTFGATTVTVTGGDFIRTVPEFQPGYTVEGEVLFADGGNSHFGFADTIQGGTYGIDDKLGYLHCPQWRDPGPHPPRQC